MEKPRTAAGRKSAHPHEHANEGGQQAYRSAPNRISIAERFIIGKSPAHLVTKNCRLPAVENIMKPQKSTVQILFAVLISLLTVACSAVPPMQHASVFSIKMGVLLLLPFQG